MRHISGPHVCGDALDIDATHNHLITGSWRKSNVLQIWDIDSGSKIKDVPQDALHKCMVRKMVLYHFVPDIRAGYRT